LIKAVFTGTCWRPKYPSWQNPQHTSHHLFTSVFIGNNCVFWFQFHVGISKFIC